MSTPPTGTRPLTAAALAAAALIAAGTLLTTAALVSSGARGASPQDAWDAGPGIDRPDLDAGREALEREDWQAAIRAFEALVARRRWDDEAHTLLAFAYRKDGNIGRALAHYGAALSLDPLNLEALEYLGEAYLQLGDTARARATLARLADACRRLAAAQTGTAGGIPAASTSAGEPGHENPVAGTPENDSSCEPWRELARAIEAHVIESRAAGRRVNPGQASRAPATGAAVGVASLSRATTVETRTSEYQVVEPQAVEAGRSDLWHPMRGHSAAP